MTELEPFEPWELPELRLTLPVTFQESLRLPTATVGISIRKRSALHDDHPADEAYFGRIAEVVIGNECWGHSPKRPDAVEPLVELDGIWFTVVLFPPGPNTRLNSLGTMHRIDRRKVESRLRKYLKLRGTGGE